MRNSRAVLVLGAVLWLAGLAAYPLLESTEGRYASVARDMAHGGSWIEPSFHSEPLFSKPPLAYWSGAVALKVLPDAEWAVRLPATLMLVLCFLLTRRLGRLAGLDDRRSRWAGFVAVLSPLAIVQGHMTTGDIFLWTGVLLSYCCLFDDRLAAPTRSALLGLGLAVGFLVKGHMVLFWVVLPTVVWAMFNRGGFRRLARLVHPLTLGVFLVLSVPWFAVALHRHPDLLDYWLGRETADRFLTTVHGRRGPWWYFLPQVPLLVLPWLAELRRGVTVRTVPAAARRFWLVWILVPLVIFSFSGSKRMNYLLPAVTPLALLVAAGVADGRSRGLRWRTGTWTAVVLAAPFLYAVYGDVPPTRKLVAAARDLDRPLAVFGTAPSAVEFYDEGRVPEFGIPRRAGPSTDGAGTAREFSRDGGVFLVRRKYLPDLARSIGREPAILQDAGWTVLAGVPRDGDSTGQ